VESTGSARQDWLVEHVRITAFRYPGVVFDARAQWSAFSKNPVEEITEKPGVQVSRLEGSLGGGRLVLSVDPQRIDWNLIPQPAETLPVPDVVFPTIGSRPEATSGFLSAGAAWLSSGDCPRLVRLAHGCVFLRPFDERAKAYKFLAAKLPTIEVDENSTDFAYQVNRPRLSKVVDGLHLNRLSKWAAIRIRVGVVSTGSESLKYPVIGEQVATRLEVDISTAAERADDIPRQLHVGLLDELVELGNEIANNGDVR